MKYKFYATSEKTWDAMLEAISSAQKSVYLEMYIFADNTESHKFFDVLKQKAQQGIRVKIIIDAFGSADLRKEAIDELRSAGAELILFSHWFHHTHRKILVVDERVAFLGGVNIHKLFRFWDDLNVRLEGPVVKNIIHSFARFYKICGGTDPLLLAQIHKTVLSETEFKLMEHWKKNFSPLKKQYKDSIEDARESILILTPYFMPRKWLITALCRAVARGVKVRVIMPRHAKILYSYSALIDRINYFYASQLCSRGMQVGLLPKMNHAKAMLIDGKKFMIGSQNLDIFSFGRNLEIGIFSENPQFVAEFKKVMEMREKEIVAFDSLNFKSRWFDFLIAPLVRLIQWIV